jgi:hypothetical protein
MQKPRYEQKDVQIKKGQRKNLTLKKNNKTKGIQTGRSLNRMNQSLKKS